MRIPQKLFHAAPECVREGIEQDGLKSNYGEIYAAGSIAEALTFMWFRILEHPHHQRVDGEVKFEMVAHDEIHIWEIETSSTGKKSWDTGTDHTASFFGNASSYVYTGGDISTDALTLHIITRDEITEALEGASNLR